MPVNFAALKAQVRQTVHNTMSMEAVYSHPNFKGEWVLRVRWHNKIARTGDLLEIGYSEIVEGINRVIFNQPELDEKSVVLRQAGVVRFTDPLMRGATLILDAQEPAAGPIETIWLVSHHT